MSDKRNDLRIELINVFCSDTSSEKRSDIDMRLTIILDKYEITARETAIVPYEEDETTAVIKKFLAAKVAKGCSLRTIQYYGKTIPDVINAIGKPYNLITADDIRLYIAKRIQVDHVSKTTANNERRNVSSFYTWLQKEEILLKNPMNKVESIKESKKKKKAYSLLDLEKIRVGCRSNRERCLCEMLASTWCRISELAQIRIDEIHDDKVTVHGKGDKDREVYINARAKIALEMYLAERKDNNPYLFPRSNCGFGEFTIKNRLPIKEMCDWYKYPELVHESLHAPLDVLEEAVRRIGKRVGVPKCHPHRFRRTGATMALRAGMPITTVSKLLGHESIETTQIYLDVSDEELEQAHRKYVT